MTQTQIENMTEKEYNIYLASYKLDLAEIAISNGERAKAQRLMDEAKRLMSN